MPATVRCVLCSTPTPFTTACLSSSLFLFLSLSVLSSLSRHLHCFFLTLTTLCASSFDVSIFPCRSGPLACMCRAYFTCCHVYCRPVHCPRRCRAKMWFVEVPSHLKVCPCRLLVCSAVGDQFEADLLEAGRNGRSAEDLAAQVRDSIVDTESDEMDSDEEEERRQATAAERANGEWHVSCFSSDL